MDGARVRFLAYVGCICLSLGGCDSTPPPAPQAPLSEKASVPKPAPVLRHIIIDDDWGGYSPRSPIRSHWDIKPVAGGYRISGSHAERHFQPSPGRGMRNAPDVDTQAVLPREVSAKAVDALVAAMRAPLQPRVDLRDLGTNPAELQKMIDDDVAKLVAAGPTPDVRKKIDAWRANLLHAEPAADALGRGLKESYHSDDFPSMTIIAEFADGSTLTFCSSSQNYLMMPWRNGDGAETFSSAIPQALVAVLPEMSTNRARLAESAHAADVGGLLTTGLANDKLRLSAEMIAPRAFSDLQSRFDLQSISYYSYTTRALDVTVALRTGPAKLVLDARLPLAGDALKRPADLDDIERKLSTAVASPGLRNAMKAAPMDKFRISWHRPDSPPQKKTSRQFVDEMSQMGRLPDIVSKPALLDGAVVVGQGRNPLYWMVLADRRAVAWKEFVVGHLPSGGKLCPGLFMEGMEDMDEMIASHPTDNCIGRVYGPDGQAE